MKNSQKYLVVAMVIIMMTFAFYLGYEDAAPRWGWAILGAMFLNYIMLVESFRRNKPTIKEKLIRQTVTQDKPISNHGQISQIPDDPKQIYCPCCGVIHRMDPLNFQYYCSSCRRGITGEK